MNTVNVLLRRNSLPIFNKYDFCKIVTQRFITSVSQEAQRQSELFDLESKRQQELVGRVEKIEVVCEGPRENTTLVMNKDLSTPFDCAKHLGEIISNRSALAVVNGDSLWHMRKPLLDSCSIQLLDYNVAEPKVVNKAYWRTCSFLLGAIISKVFKDNIQVNLHSFPSPNVRSGSFICDAQLSLDNWKATDNELRVLSAEMVKFCQEDHPLQCLDVTADFALLMFKNNLHKTQQIPNIAAGNKGTVTLFKAGHHVDISKGPMVTSTGHVGRVTVTNIFKLHENLEGGPLYRFQGVSLPKSIILNHFAYGLLEDRAKKLNPARVPGAHEVLDEQTSFA